MTKLAVVRRGPKARVRNDQPSDQTASLFMVISWHDAAEII